MCHFKDVLLVGVTFLVFVESARQKADNSCAKSCYIQRVHQMLSADCYNLSCRRFPTKLPSDIEVIDAAYNRIRDISQTDLESYTRLKYLYLGDNMISKIHQDALADKDSLVALDLSLNSFASPAAIPEVIFQLPSLKSLYLSQNQNINVIEAIENAVPIRAPLEHLDISFNSEELVSLPIMGLVPTLIRYNVSGMSLILNTSQFAGLCNLEIWVNANVTTEFVDPCDCWRLDWWLRDRKVVFDNFTQQCIVQKSECDNTINEEDLDFYTSCKKEHAEQVYQTKLNKSLLIGGCVLGVVVIILIIVLWKWRRTRVRQRREKKAFLTKMDDGGNYINGPPPYADT